jgi:hypothetical protein
VRLAPFWGGLVTVLQLFGCTPHVMGCDCEKKKGAVVISPDEIKLLTCTQHQQLCVYPSTVYKGPSTKLKTQQCKFDIQEDRKHINIMC